MTQHTRDHFLEAARLATQGFYAEAAAGFMAAADREDPELSDDCLVNAGICYLQIGLFDEAIAAFQREIDTYPGSTLDDALHAGEHGETSAKSRYGILQAHAALGRTDQARAVLQELAGYDSLAWVTGPQGERITYHQLGERFLESLAADDTPEVIANEGDNSDG